MLEMFPDKKAGTVVVSGAGPVAVSIDTKGLTVKWSGLKTNIDACEELTGFGLAVARNVSD